jgi:hypothetical protein
VRCHRSWPALLGLAILLPVVAARADNAGAVYEAIGIAPAQVLTSTISTTLVMPGPDRQIVSMVTFLTGKRDSGATNVRLDVLGKGTGSCSRSSAATTVRSTRATWPAETCSSSTSTATR